MIYVDTSALVKLYFPEPDSARVARLVQGTPLAFTRLHELEVESAFGQKLFTRTAKPRQVTAARALFTQDLLAGVLVRQASDWETLLADAAVVASREASRLGCRSLDVLHCVAARALSLVTFVTSDGRQRALAARLGMKCPVP